MPAARANQNVEVVQRIFDALQRRDVEGMLPVCDPELEFISLIGAVEGRSSHGHEGMRMFVADLSQAWDVWQPVAEHFESAGDAVLAIGQTHLRGKGSGVEIEISWGQVFRFRNGKVLWSRIYSDRADARTEFQALAA
jgi:ketosteroid isomerase-like protein